METETSTRPAGRPRPWLLIALAIVVALALISWLPGNPAAPSPRPSNPRTASRVKTPDNVQPGDLDVRLDTLKEERPAPESSDRNPFRFYVKPPPPPPTPVKPVVPPPTAPVDSGPPPPPPPPPIPLKYIGLLEEKGGTKLAAFSDCRSTMRAHEGDIIAGQYRLVKIGVESVVMEYVDGRGRTTIRLSGQECVGK